MMKKATVGLDRFTDFCGGMRGKRGTDENSAVGIPFG